MNQLIWKHFAVPAYIRVTKEGVGITLLACVINIISLAVESSPSAAVLAKGTEAVSVTLVISQRMLVTTVICDDETVGS